VHAGMLPIARHCELGPHGEGTQGLPLGSSGRSRITGALPLAHKQQIRLKFKQN